LEEDTPSQPVIIPDYFPKPSEEVISPESVIKNPTLLNVFHKMEKVLRDHG
jgi:hypothetical protein